jgi:hypothetical protein
VEVPRVTKQLFIEMAIYQGLALEKTNYRLSAFCVVSPDEMGVPRKSG